jgi:[acyl-carrier-protein] S-malonyltransferase
MGRAAADRSPRARAIFERADRVLGFELSRICFEGPAERLEQTDVQQPAIFVASAALWEAMLEAGVPRDRFSHAAGLSLGEYTALYAAGALDFDGAVELVHRRGQLMQQAAEATPGGMICLIGADEQAAWSIARESADGEVLAPANFNCPGQVVLSGARQAVDRARQLAETQGFRVVSLPVAGAFHTALMSSAVEEFRPLLEAISFNPPRIPVASNVDAHDHGAPDEIRASLAKQITSPVLWQRCVERLIADGVTAFVEIGPGRVLSGLIRKINRAVSVRAVNSPEDMAPVLPSAI